MAVELLSGEVTAADWSRDDVARSDVSGVVAPTEAGSSERRKRPGLAREAAGGAAVVGGSYLLGRLLDKLLSRPRLRT